MPGPDVFPRRWAACLRLTILNAAAGAGGAARRGGPVSGERRQRRIRELSHIPDCMDSAVFTSGECAPRSRGNRK